MMQLLVGSIPIPFLLQIGDKIIQKMQFLIQNDSVISYILECLDDQVLLSHQAAQDDPGGDDML